MCALNHRISGVMLSSGSYPWAGLMEDGDCSSILLYSVCPWNVGLVLLAVVLDCVVLQIIVLHCEVMGMWK